MLAETLHHSACVVFLVHVLPVHNANIPSIVPTPACRPLIYGIYQQLSSISLIHTSQNRRFLTLRVSSLNQARLNTHRPIKRRPHILRVRLVRANTRQERIEVQTIIRWANPRPRQVSYGWHHHLWSTTAHPLRLVTMPLCARRHACGLYGGTHAAICAESCRRTGLWPAKEGGEYIFPRRFAHHRRNSYDCVACNGVFEGIEDFEVAPCKRVDFS